MTLTLPLLCLLVALAAFIAAATKRFTHPSYVPVGLAFLTAALICGVLA